jgi:hypothetical protein
MLTDNEIDALASQILSKAIGIVSDWKPPRFVRVDQMDSGELIPVFAGSHPGYGSYHCDYFVFDAVKQMIRDCEALFEAFYIELKNPQTGSIVRVKLSEKMPEVGELSVRIMAETATVYMLNSFTARMQETLEESIEDGKFIAQTTLQSVTAKELQNLEFVDAVADMRLDIDEAVDRVGRRKRKELIAHVAELPNVLAARKRGAPPKSPLTRERERAEYIQRIQEVYRELRLEANKKPSKTSVVKKLGEGGFNPKTGGESYLQAFRLKLIRLDIEYDETVKQVEDEVNNKPK